MTHVPYPGCYCADCVEGPDIEAAAWDWLNRAASSICDECPSDIAYSADQMVDAFVAGNAFAPSARITGDKDRENPVEGAPLAKEAADRLRLWFFRECNSGTRRQLFSIFGLPLDEIRNHGAERLCFNHILAALGDNRRLATECHRLRAALRWIADTGYVDHQSGNQNFEHLQSIARDALTKEPTS